MVIGHMAASRAIVLAAEPVIETADVIVVDVIISDMIVADVIVSDVIVSGEIKFDKIFFQVFLQPDMRNVQFQNGPTQRYHSYIVGFGYVAN